MFWYFRVVFSGFNTCVLGFCALVTMLVILLTVLSDRLIRSDLDIVWNCFDLRISCPECTCSLILEQSNTISVSNTTLMGDEDEAGVPRKTSPDKIQVLGQTFPSAQCFLRHPVVLLHFREDLILDLYMTTTTYWYYQSLNLVLSISLTFVPCAHCAQWYFYVHWYYH